MCLACYQELGPGNLTDRAREAAKLLALLDEYGAAHIVVEDWNLRDGDIEFCLNRDHCTPEDETALLALLALPFDERVAAMALAEEFIT